MKIHETLMTSNAEHCQTKLAYSDIPTYLSSAIALAVKTSTCADPRLLSQPYRCRRSPAICKPQLLINDQETIGYYAYS